MNYAVFIARMQPFHLAHYEILKHTLERYDRVVIGVGSARQARSPKNPWTVDERIELVRRSLTPAQAERVAFIPLRDYLYNDNQWITDVQQRVQAITEIEPGPVSIVGRLKDRTSYYIRLFPQWQCDEYTAVHPQNATDTRRALFECDWAAVESSVPGPVYAWLQEWAKTDTFAWVLEEHRHYAYYKSLFKGPYPTTFVTTDAVVIQSGHVLVVRRRAAPGRGLYALPGGFLGQTETVEAGMLRELKEETRLQLPKEVLKGCIVSEHVFDHPDRSLRGRTITHGYCIHLRDGELADVKGDDDADKAFWMPLADMYEHEDKFFEDHVHIIRYFTSRF